MKSTVTIPCDTERLHIREFEESDRDSLLDFVVDKKQLQYMLFSLGTEKEIDDFLAFFRREAQEERRIQWHFAIEVNGKPGCIGGVALMIELNALSSAELGYWLKRLFWGKGFAAEASRFVLELGFHRLGLHRIWAKCHIGNPSSARVMEKLGMKKEGEVREHVWLRDHYRSSFLYSILDREYVS